MKPQVQVNAGGVGIKEGIELGWSRRFVLNELGG